jgi:cytochrome c-type biogenesis protein CcmH
MTQFWIAALALGLVAAAIVLVPVLRAWSKQDTDRSSSALGVGIVVALAIPVVTMMLYARWTTWDWSTGGSTLAAGADEVHEMDAAIVALEQRLAQNPGDVESWMLLGRSYMSQRRFGEAARAFRQAAAQDGQDNPQILADLGEALALSDPEGLQGEAGAIFERVLAVSPSHPKGLWYGGLNAYENANWALADQRLSLLLTLNPPETLIPLIQERVDMARTHSGDAPQAAMMGMPPRAQAAPEPETPVVAAEPESAPGSAPAPAPVEQPAALPSVAAAPEAGTEPPPATDAISLEVSLDPALAARIQGPTPVFIIARNPAGGPPLAVIRSSTAELPMSVRLTDANAMMEGVTILDQAELELIARVSLSGSPAQRPGDLFGAVNYVRGNSGTTRIRIDRVAD